MKKSFLKFLPVLFLSLIVFSCSKKDKTGLLVPRGAALVVHINGASLSSKFSWKDMQATDFFQNIVQHNPDTLALQLMSDSVNTGIDKSSDFVCFFQKKAGGGYIVFEGKLTDAANFGSFAKKILPDVKQTAENGFSFASSTDRYLLGWNDKRFVYIIDANGFSMNPFEKQAHSNLDTLKSYGRDILNLSGTETLGADKRFAALVNEPGDIHIWVNTQPFTEGGMMESYLTMMKFNVLLEDNVSATTLSFDNGKIDIKSKQYFGSEVSALLKNYQPDNVEASLINRLPSNSLAVFALNYPPEGIKQLLRLVGADGMVNAYLGERNYSLNEFVQANKGKMLLALNGIGRNSRQDTIGDLNGAHSIMTNNQFNIQFLFANAINDKAAFDKLVTGIKPELNKIQSELNSLDYVIKDGWFVMGSSKENISGFLSNNNQHLAFASRISGHPFGGYIDLQKIMDATAPSSRDSIAMNIFQASKNMWQDVVITGGDYKSGALEYHTEINLVDKNTNSLKQLVRYFDQSAGRIIFGRKNRMGPQTDSLRMDIPKKKAF